MRHEYMLIMGPLSQAEDITEPDMNEPHLREYIPGIHQAHRYE